MTDETIRILIAIYPNSQAAEDGLKKVETAKQDQGVDIIDAAVVRRDENNQLHIHETEDVTGRRGATVGGILGGVLGIMAGPGGILAGVAVGAVVGAAAASAIDTGIPHKRLTEIGNQLKPGGAALVILTEAGFSSFIESALGDEGVNLHAEMMDAEAARRLGHAHDVALKALNMGEALSEGGMASPTDERPSKPS
ncbi:MAG TPA: DUF1269 domain-containing protein [Anaerolineae bacterium]|nr:DUF1269 domain-containing protein [Anaerolineae bacterium]